MSFSTKFQTSKKAVKVVYGAEKAPLALSMAKRERAHELSNHLARTKTGYLLNIPNPEEGIDMWWSSEERGVSFAACIDEWSDERRRSDPAALADYVVVIASATHLYLAEVSGYRVQAEWVVSEPVARARLEAYSAEGKVIHGFTTGDQPGAADEYVRLDALPFELDQYKYRRAVIVYTKTGMVHPSVLYAVLGLCLLAAIMLYGEDIARELLGTRSTPAETSDEPVILKAEYGAGVLLRYLTNYVARVDPLHADGLTSLQFHYPSVLILSGQSDTYPGQARDFAEQVRGRFLWNSGGWEVNMDLSIPRLTTALPPDTDQALQAFIEGWPDVELVDGPNVVEAAVNTQFSVSKVNITTYDLIEWAARLDGYPAYLRSMECTYERYLLISCTLSIETTTL